MVIPVFSDFLPLFACPIHYSIRHCFLELVRSGESVTSSLESSLNYVIVIMIARQMTAICDGTVNFGLMVAQSY